MSFITHSSQMLLWRMVSIALGVVTSIFLARLLGPEDRGTLAILMLSVSLACVIVNLGTAEASIYLLGSGVEDSKVIICSLFYYYTLIIAVLALPAFVLTKHLTDLTPHIIALLIALTGIGILNTHLRHFLIGQKRFAQYNLAIVLDSLIFLIGVSFLWCWDRISVSNVVVIYALSGLLLLLVSISRWFNNQLLSRPRLSYLVIPQAIKYGFHLFITGVGGFGVQRITYFFLEFFTGSKAVGLFAVANTLPALFANIPQQIATVLYSHVANSPDKKKNIQLTLLVIKVLAIVSLFFLAPVVLFAEPISFLLFGREFSGIGKSMIILSIGMALSGLGSVIFNLLAGSALHKYGSYMTLISLFFVCLFSVVLIPRLGLEGAAFSHLIAMCLSFLFIGTVFCVVFRVKPYRLFVFSVREIELVVSNLTKCRRL
jgi:O-antigen/teichoic acid export membrane protein